jgi:hypothetical protein
MIRKVKTMSKNLKVKLEIQHFEGCPNSIEFIKHVKEAIKGNESKYEYSETLVETNEIAEKVKFRGSPTLLIDGIDLEGLPENETPSLACRFYSNGIPSVKDIKQKISK